MALSPALSVIFGTYNRLNQLQRCVLESRKSVGSLGYEFVVSDGGSTDGSREWLASQPDVVMVDGGLSGAVAAYNAAHEKARGQFIAILNDDCAPVGITLSEAVEILQGNARVGQVAIPFDRQGKSILATHREHPVASYCVIRADTAKAVAATCGGLWNPIYHTYAADWELSCLTRELGWEITTFSRVGVLDFGHETQDALRSQNKQGRKQDSTTFYDRWPRTGAPNLRAEETVKIIRHNRVTPRQRVVSECDPKPGEMPPRTLGNEPKERVLHLHLSAPGNEQESQVRALTALGSRGYIRVPVQARDAQALAYTAAKELRPSIAFVQTQQPRLTAKFFRGLREAADNPALVICTWAGDVGCHDAPNQRALAWAIEAAAEVDLTLWSSWTHVEVLRDARVTAAYLQIGYDEEYFYEPQEDPSKLDVVFLFNSNHHKPLGPYRTSLGAHDDCDARAEAATALQKAFKNAVVGAAQPALVGSGDLYRQARLAVSISASCSLVRYTSDRLFRAMACTATAVKRFSGWESFGLKHEENCLLFDSTEELIDLAKHWTAPEQGSALRDIRKAGAKLVREHHTWGVRMRELRPLIAAARASR